MDDGITITIDCPIICKVYLYGIFHLLFILLSLGLMIFAIIILFSEDIIVRKGYELINKFLSTEELCKKDNWQENMEMQCSRTIDLIK